jgi:hypothetical protein
MIIRALIVDIKGLKKANAKTQYIINIYVRDIN